MKASLVKTLFIVFICFSLSACSFSQGFSSNPPKDDFLDMFSSSLFPLWISTEYTSPEAILNDKGGLWYMQGLLTYLRLQYNEKNQIPAKKDNHGNVYFTTKELSDISNDLLGYSYPILSDTVANKPEQDMIFPPTISLDETSSLNFRINENSFQAQNGQITIESDFVYTDPSDESKTIWKINYSFSYHPEQLYVPYRLNSAQVVEGTPWFTVLSS